MLHERKISNHSTQIKNQNMLFLGSIVSYWHHSKAQIHTSFLCVSTLCIRVWCLELAEPELNAQFSFVPLHLPRLAALTLGNTRAGAWS